MTPRADERTWAMWCHLAAFVGMLGVPLGNIVGPVVAWQIKREESAFVDEHGRESVNFQISFLLYAIVAAIALVLFLIFVVGVGAGINTSDGRTPAAAWMAVIVSGAFVPLLGLLLFPFFAMVFVVIAALHAHRGRHYRYPLTIRFLR
jgi:uncharacterized Tic20 family protein